jgi:hypothetical protein
MQRLAARALCNQVRLAACHLGIGKIEVGWGYENHMHCRAARELDLQPTNQPSIESTHLAHLDSRLARKSGEGGQYEKTLIPE